VIRRLLSILFATVVLLACSTPRAPVSKSTHSDDETDRVIAQRMKESGIVGLGAAIIIDGRVVWTKGYGFADKDRAVPFTPETVMNIGSISKTVTGVAMMQAVQDGKLSLDEDISTWLPFKVVNPWYPDAKITLRNLATHTSGITDREEVYETTYHYSDAPEPLGEFLESYLVPGGKHYTKNNFLKVQPGTHREYSNIGAGLAGYVVERAVSQKLNAYTRRRIFEPLRMDHTGWSLAEIGPTRHSTLYAAKSGVATPIPLYELTTYPDGGVRTSVADLSKFFVALLNGGTYEGTRILQPRSTEEMLRFQHTDSNKPDNVNLQEYNSGLFWRTKFNGTRVGHGGTDPGVMTDMLANLSRDTGVILFVNTTLSDTERRHYGAIYDALWKHAEALKARRLN